MPGRLEASAAALALVALVVAGCGSSAPSLPASAIPTTAVASASPSVGPAASTSDSPIASAAVSPSPAGSPSGSGTSSTAGSPSAAVSPSTAATGAGLLVQKTGHGDWTSPAIRTMAQADVSVDYTFDCTSVGSGGLIVYLLDAASGETIDLLVEADGTKAAATTHTVESAGTYEVQVHSPCSWNITVRGASGPVG